MRKNIPRKKPTADKGSRSILKLTRKQFMVWFGITFLAMVWMFFLGILVGRDSSPVRFDVPQIKEDLVTLKQKVLPKGETASEAEPEDMAEDPDLEFYSALREKPEESGLAVKKAVKTPPEPKAKAVTRPATPEAAVKKPEVVPEKAGGAPAEPDLVSARLEVKRAEPKIKPVASKAGEEAPQKPVEKVAGKEAPVPQKTERVGRYTIQVAAFKNVDRARELIVYLRKKGYDAYQATATLPDKGTYHRVRVGHFASKSDAAQIASKLGQNKLETVIVRE